MTHAPIWVLRLTWDNREIIPGHFSCLALELVKALGFISRASNTLTLVPYHGPVHVSCFRSRFLFTFPVSVSVHEWYSVDPARP